MICPKCSKAVTVDQRFRVSHTEVTNDTPGKVFVEHVNCDDPTNGALAPTMEQTVSPEGIVCKMKKAIA